MTKFVILTPNQEARGLTFLYPNALFHNNGDGSFADVSSTSWRGPAQPSMGVACADYDNDGLGGMLSWAIGTEAINSSTTKALVGRETIG